MTENEITPKGGQILIYQTENGQTQMNVRLEGQTMWLSQAGLAELYQTTKQNISLHIQNIYDEGELSEDSVVKEYLTTAVDGKKYKTKHYNLDMIISVGYRIKSHIATRFRQWATQKLREYIVKGFVLDDQRLKDPQHPLDYFDELLKRIQEIRTSERRFYQKITDIYATSVDYDPTNNISIEFFKTVQNKLHWAITGMTAAEIVYKRADAAKTNMGLTNWRGEKVRKEDVVIAKNYLGRQELAALNNLVEQYLIFAEGQAIRRLPMYMKDWVSKLDGFLQLNDRNILNDAGKISHEMAVEQAEAEYVRFDKKRIEWYDQQDSDFDKTMKLIEAKKKKLKKKRENG